MLQAAPRERPLELTAKLLHELAESVWNSMLELELWCTDSASVVFPASAQMLAGRIAIRGAWRGQVVLACSRLAARKAAAIMFKIPPARISALQQNDALGELTHILSGNLKSLLPAPSSISLPVVTEGYNTAVEGRLVGQVLLRCENQPLQLTLYEQEKL